MRPLQDRAACLRSHPLPVRRRIHDPAHFGFVAELGLNIAPGGEQSDVADEPTVGLAIDSPGPEAVELPIADRCEKPPPAILRRRRLGTEVAVNLRLATVVGGLSMTKCRKEKATRTVRVELRK